jgi:hypothetical protein
VAGARCTCPTPRLVLFARAVGGQQTLPAALSTKPQPACVLARAVAMPVTSSRMPRGGEGAASMWAPCDVDTGPAGHSKAYLFMIP